MSKIMETVLVVGATGNVGVAAIFGALKTKRSVLAIVRNQFSADKLFKHVGTKDGITTVEADVTSETGVQDVIEQVKAGKLPTFQHVYCCGVSRLFLENDRCAKPILQWANGRRTRCTRSKPRPLAML